MSGNNSKKKSKPRATGQGALDVFQSDNKDRGKNGNVNVMKPSTLQNKQVLSPPQ